MYNDNEETTESDNELIAEFMGMAKIPINDKENQSYPLYDVSWDWLMPVVEKIESLGYETEIKYDQSIFVRIGAGGYENQTQFMSDGRTKIEATHKAVVEFIKWYANQQTP